MLAYPYHHEIPKNAIFLRSDATGQIYALDELPEFFGSFSIVSREEYESYIKHHLG